MQQKPTVQHSMHVDTLGFIMWLFSLVVSAKMKANAICSSWVPSLLRANGYFSNHFQYPFPRKDFSTYWYNNKFTAEPAGEKDISR